MNTVRLTTFVFLAVISLTLNHCKKDNTVSLLEGKEFFIFGHYYGHCAGEECVEVFMLMEEKLYEDTTDSYPPPIPSDIVYTEELIALSAEQYEVARNLPDAFPDQLLEVENATVFGIPDAGDWGGLYVAIGIQDVDLINYQYWYIDTQKQNVPDYLHPLIDEIQQTIEAINR